TRERTAGRRSAPAAARRATTTPMTTSRNRVSARPARDEPLPLEKLSKKVCRGLRGIFSDIDDTLTCHGKLTEDAFAAMGKPRRAGLRMIPITGRPAGWVDHL